MKNIYKYGLLFVCLSFLGYNSVYFEKLSDRQAQEKAEFDFQAYADSLYYQGILKKEVSTSLYSLLAAIKDDTEGAFAKYGNRLGIGNSAYFMVKCEGTITELANDEISLNSTNTGPVIINTKYIFGNALRDASGLVELTDFKTNAEFNKLSEALNSLVRTKVMPPIIEKLAIGDSIQVVGAIKLSKKDLTDPSLMITPAQITPQ